MERRQAAREQGVITGRWQAQVTETKDFFIKVCPSQPLEGHHPDDASGSRLAVPHQPRGPDGSMGFGAERRLHRAGVGD